MSNLDHPLEHTLFDDLVTDTSEEQSKTESIIRQLLSLYDPRLERDGATGLLRVSGLKLERQAHIRWLLALLNPLPAPYTSLDASRPWLLYWVTHSMAIMNATFDGELKKRGIDTIKSFWNNDQGGFGGGPGQMAHLAPTYASVSALCYLGGPLDAWDWLDRQVKHLFAYTLANDNDPLV